MALPTVDIKVEGHIVPVQRAILALASPVFRELLEKQDAKQPVELPGKSRPEFEAFLRFLEPRTSRAHGLSLDSVDFLLRWSDEFEVEALRAECEDFLLACPCCSVERLLQAHRHRLARQLPRCVAEVGRRFFQLDVEKVAEEAPELLREMLPHMKRGALKEMVASAASATRFMRRVADTVQREHSTSWTGKRKLSEVYTSTAARLVEEEEAKEAAMGAAKAARVHGCPPAEPAV